MSCHRDYCHAGCGPHPTKETLILNHGTPATFAAAVRAAIGEISPDEAYWAIRRYEIDWCSAPDGDPSKADIYSMLNKWGPDVKHPTDVI